MWAASFFDRGRGNEQPAADSLRLRQVAVAAQERRAAHRVGAIVGGDSEVASDVALADASPDALCNLVSDSLLGSWFVCRPTAPLCPFEGYPAFKLSPLANENMIVRAWRSSPKFRRGSHLLLRDGDSPDSSKLAGLSRPEATGEGGHSSSARLMCGVALVRTGHYSLV